jgi:hypothetical protein
MSGGAVQIDRLQELEKGFARTRRLVTPKTAALSSAHLRNTVLSTSTRGHAGNVG